MRLLAYFFCHASEFPQLQGSRSGRIRREELQIVADELLREVDAAAIDTANVSIASALEHLCTLEDALIALWQYADRPYPDPP